MASRPIRVGLAAIVLLGAAACTSTREVRTAGGSREYLITCGYLGWYICYEKAQEICPGRYKALSESEGYGPKELRIACPAK